MFASRFWFALAVIASVASGGLAHAGARAVPTVSISEAARTASGMLGTPHGPGNRNYIRCSLASGPTVDCEARAGTLRATCLTSDPESVAVVTALNDDSHLSFRWATNGTCTSITAYSGSLTTQPPMPQTVSRSNAVTIDLARSSARGIASDTFNSTDDVEFIGCSVSANGTSVTAQCFATSSTGERVSCNVAARDTESLQIIRAMHATSSVEFAWEGDALPRVNDAVCTFIRVLTSAEHSPLVRHPL